MNGHERIKHPEHDTTNPEELEKAGIEQRQEIEKQLEKRHERSLEDTSAEREARQEALERAKEHEPTNHEQRETISPAERRRGPITKKERDASFNTAMRDVQSQMSTPSRMFSKLIHNKAVEKTSEVVGSTLARPNAILSGAVFAFILTLGIYVVAKNIGYPLSGFETIAAFIIGWLLGTAYDFVKVMVTGRK